MANATAQSGDDPATDYHSANDSSRQVGGNRSSQEDNWEAERYPRDSRANPGLQSASHPQSDGQPRQRAEPRAGLASQSDSQLTREEASVRILELIDHRTNHGQGTHIRAWMIAGVCMSEH